MISTKICQKCKNQFEITAEDRGLLEILKAPEPTFCPQCRMQRKFVWRNERSLYKRVCDLCKKEKVLMYPQSSPFIVYCKECWWSDGWDPMGAGREYDFSRSFFEQWQDLMRAVPRMGKIQQGENVGSEYTNRVTDMRNCYLVVASVNDEYCRYGYWFWFSKESLDGYNVTKSERTYECIDCRLCYNVAFSQESSNCRDSWLLYNCVNASNCFGCVNLRNKQYCFLNEQLTKEAYEQKIRESALGSYEGFKKLEQQFGELRKQFIVPAMVTHQSVSIGGNWIESCRNTYDAYQVTDCDNVRHAYCVTNTKDSMDFTNWGYPAEKVYETISAGRQIANSKFLNECWDQVIDCEYSMNCHGVKNLFGCVGLRKKEYCILNKQYSQEEYERLAPLIKKQMDEMPYVDSKGRVYKYGEFFSAELSLFAYNETIAQEYFPLTKEQALEQGFAWRDEVARDYKITAMADSLPDKVSDASDALVKDIIGCAHAGQCKHQCTTAFRILAEDLALYKRALLPLPRLCPNCRHFERLAKRNPLKSWPRTCQCIGTTADGGVYKNNAPHEHGGTKCQNTFETSYAPDRPEKVYCISCYQSEVA